MYRGPTLAFVLSLLLFGCTTAEPTKNTTSQVQAPAVSDSGGSDRGNSGY